MLEGSYRALRVLMFVIAVLEVIGGLLLIATPGWLISVAPGMVHFGPSGFVIVLLKLVGVLTFAFAYLSYVTARDPVRYVAVIDSLIFLALAAVAVELYELYVLHISPFQQVQYVIFRSVLRILFAIVLIALRPRVPAVGTAQ